MAFIFINWVDCRLSRSTYNWPILLTVLIDFDKNSFTPNFNSQVVSYIATPNWKFDKKK